MSIWDRGLAAIDAVMQDPDALIYTGAGLVSQPVQAVRLDGPADEFDSHVQGNSLRRVEYEVDPVASGMTADPRKTNSFTHRGRRWVVEQATWRPELGRWRLIVADAGAA